MILTLNNFKKGQWELPHSHSAPNQADNTELICSYIDRYERELLIDALGVTLYNEIKAEAPNFSTSSKVEDLVKGKEYDVNGKNVTWGGVEAMLTPYVYFRFLQDQTEIFGTFGIERPEGVNSQGVSSIPKAVHAWSDFLEKYQNHDTEGLVYHTGLIHGVDYYNAISIRRSLYQFLTDNSDVYGNLNFRFYETMNTFGI